MRVSVVEVSPKQIMFAPHTDAKWLTRDLSDDLGDAPPEVGQVGEFEEDSSGWIFLVDPDWRVELCGLKAVGGPELMTFQVNGPKTVIDLTDHGVPLTMKNKAERLKFWRLIRCDGEGAVVPDQARLHGHFNHPDLAFWGAEIEEEAAAREQRQLDGSYSNVSGNQRRSRRTTSSIRIPSSPSRRNRRSVVSRMAITHSRRRGRKPVSPAGSRRAW